MNTQNKLISDTEEAWENRTLGADEEYVAVSNLSDEIVDASLDLQPISIRLHKALIEDFKIIAKLNGLGYQTLMRQVLKRFSDAEKKKILRSVAKQMDDAAASKGSGSEKNAA